MERSGNKYLEEGAARAPKVREMFSRIAGRYDFLNDVISLGMHRGWKRQAVALALDGADRSRGRILDLCCGTGDLSFFAEELGAASITGVDFALPMLAVARRRRAMRSARSRFLEADALRLPFADAAFDAVTIGYGLRNLADIPAALDEIRRVLAPGGRAVVLDFGKPHNPIVAALYGAYLRLAMPVIGLLFHGDAATYAYIPVSLARYPGQRGVEALMRQAGFANARFEERLFGATGLNVGEAP